MPYSRLFRLVLIAAVLAAAIWIVRGGWPGGTPQDAGQDEAGAVTAGGTLRATYSTEPTNYLRLAASTAPNLMLSHLTQASLVRATADGEWEPRLAERWTISPDGLTWTFDLRQDARFSDGSPVTAADVVFTVRAAQASAIAGELRVGGQPVTARATAEHQVVFTLPAPYGPGLTMVENLFILPRHRLEAALDAGTLATVWTMSSAPADVVGAGPFVVREHVPGQRIRFERNPHFFGRDGQGRPLPYLDGIDMSIVPEANTEMLRLLGGDSDVITSFALPDDLAALRQAAAEGRVQLADAGPTVDVWTLWFDLRPNAPSAAERPWLQAPEFRRALSHAINRQAIVDTVYLGQAVPVYGPLSPGHGPWYQPDLPRTEFDLTRARALLSSIGLTDRNGDGTLEDAANRPVRFSILTRSGVPHRERTVAVIQEQLRPLGIAVDVVTLPANEIVQRFSNGQFDAIYFGALSSTREPGAGFWLSSGPFHFWHPGQTTPVTDWEARIDQLFQQQAGTVDRAERVRIFAEAQRLLAEQLPALWLVAPRQIVPVSGRLRGATPQIFFPPVLWNAEQISLANGGR